MRRPERPASAHPADRPTGQVPVRLGTGLVYLDVVHRVTMTNFELDGARWHGSSQSRERDLRRDAAEVRAEILAILASARTRA